MTKPTPSNRALIAPIQGVTIREPTKDDWIKIAAGFVEAFGVQRSMAEWQWKYGTNFERVHAQIALDSESNLIAYYGSLIGVTQIDGATHKTFIPMDVYRLKRQGTSEAMVFSALTQDYLKKITDEQKFDVGFGFPGLKHLEIGIKRLGYPDAVAINALQRKPKINKRAKAATTYGLSEQMDTAAVARLWQSARHRYPVAQVRDQVFLEQRFVTHPKADYRYKSLLLGDETQAWAVLRLTVGKLQVVDLIWNGHDDEALRCLDDAIVEEATRQKAKHIEMWLNGDAAANNVLQKAGWATAVPPALGFVALSYTPTVDAENVVRRMYLTLGDSDLA